MSIKRWSEAMGELDNKYIDEAVSYKPKTRHISRRWPVVLIAASLAVLLIGCVAAAAAGVFGTSLIKIFKSETEGGTDFSESGYDLAVDIERIPVNELKGGVSEAGDAIRKQFADFNPALSWMPGSLQYEFSTREEALAYIGYDGIKQLDFGAEEQASRVYVNGNEEGQILSLDLETGYTAGDIRIQLFSSLYTEYTTDEITYAVRTTEDVDYTESFYTTAGGKPCQIIDESAQESGYKCMDGYIVDHGVLHNLHLAFREKDAEQARRILLRWADQF